MSTVYTMGEALIDFIPNEKGIGLKDVTAFYKAPGGAPANVACAVAKLGGNSAFIGKLGTDAFGDALVDTLRGVGVDTRYIMRTHEANTALAFVTLKADGNRDFMFYRNPSADMLLSKDEIRKEWFKGEDILHFGSVDLIEAPVKYAHIEAIYGIKEKGGMVSFDPNVRLFLWDSKDACRKTILDFVPMSNILKISDEELEFITGIRDEKEAVQSLFVGDVEIIIYTKGSKGAEIYTKSFHTSVEGLAVNVVDTTGAGDAFIGAFLYKMSVEDMRITDLTKEKAREILVFANIVAAITTTKKGAIASLPEMEETKQFMKVRGNKE
ncbi:MAG: PfkB family carbohydrate kinase [Bacillota bacterium]